MDSGSQKLLESATIRTLHAHNFSRSSTQASLVLTDLFSRYLHLLTSTCGKYAQHAGRTKLSIRDVVEALSELGMDVAELKEYASIEGAELGRYAIKSARRMEDLNDFRGAFSLAYTFGPCFLTILAANLQEGLKQDVDDVVPLEYRPFSPPPEDSSEDEDQEMEDVEAYSELTIPRDPLEDVNMADLQIRPSRPPDAPLSPVSNPSSPVSRRYANSSWDPPEHIPDFLPAFPQPTIEESRPASPSHDESRNIHFLNPLAQETEEQPDPTGAITAAAPSDFNTRVPYDQSSLAAVPEWHLHFPTISADTTTQPSYPIPQKDRALYGAYHGLLTSTLEPSQHTAGRHRVAMSMLELMSGQTGKSRWDLPDTLFGSVMGNKPRVTVMAPSHPVPLNKGASDAKFPVTSSATGIIESGWSEGSEALVNRQGGRMGLLAKAVLPVRETYLPPHTFLNMLYIGACSRPVYSS